MPAAAVTPAPRVSVVDVAVKKSVVVDKLKRLLVKSGKRFRNSGTDRGCSMHKRAMECQDLVWTNRGEGDIQVRI